MSPNSRSLDVQFIPQDPIHPEGTAFFSKITSMLDGQPKDEAEVESALVGSEGWLEKIASELYRLASMLLGEGEETIHLIEEVVTEVDIPSCRNHAEARNQAYLKLAGKSIGILAARDSGSLAAPFGEDGPVSCIESDDLDAAGISADQLEEMLDGPDSYRLRTWLEGLTPGLRVIFVLRAVAALSSAEVAGLLAGHGGVAAEGWTPDAVRSAFRQALCSLASQLLHESTTH
jgi:hypothetical protein